MAVEEAGTHTISTCTVEISPGEVYAGADVMLKGKVSCSLACDLRGQSLRIIDQNEVEVDRLELAEFEGETNETAALVLNAPVKAGAYTWSVVYPAHVKEGILHEETSAPFSFTVKAHTTTVTVWGVPSAITSGERFSIKVGMKCSTECTLTGREFEIYNHEGARVATGTLGGDPWPGTAALYFAEVELEAPDTVGDYRWEAKFPESDLELPHEAGSCTFGVKTVSPPECLVTVEAIDKEKQTPIKGAHVLLHPYRAFTDEHGVAKVRVAKGEYKLFVSGFNYITFRTPVEVMGNLTTRAELSVEPEESVDDHY